MCGSQSGKPGHTCCWGQAPAHDVNSNSVQACKTLSCINHLLDKAGVQHTALISCESCNACENFRRTRLSRTGACWHSMCSSGPDATVRGSLTILTRHGRPYICGPCLVRSACRSKLGRSAARPAASLQWAKVPDVAAGCVRAGVAALCRGCNCGPPRVRRPPKHVDIQQLEGACVSAETGARHILAVPVTLGLAEDACREVQLRPRTSPIVKCAGLRPVYSRSCPADIWAGSRIFGSCKGRLDFSVPSQNAC